MEVINGSRCAVDTAFTLDQHGREHLLVVAKASYRIPADGKRPSLTDPAPIVVSDQAGGEAGLSAPLYEADLAPTKPACDILLTGKAHTPLGRPRHELGVRLQVGSVCKDLVVIGRRHWRRRLLDFVPSPPEPFTCLDLHYGHAFGGCRYDRNGDMQDAFAPNPIGMGYAVTRPDGQPAPLPHLEHPRHRIRSYRQRQVAAAYSPLGRHWQGRRELAGRYDQRWQDERFPLLPEDFDERYFQAAPPDQRCEYLQGGESVVLVNLLANRPRAEFRLPRLALEAKALDRDNAVQDITLRVDTLHLDTEAQCFSAVFRGSLPLTSPHGIKVVVVGPVCRAWWRGKVTGTAGGCGCGGRNPPDCRDCPDQELAELGKPADTDVLNPAPKP